MPDVTPWHFFLLGYLKPKVNINITLKNFETLKEMITEEVEAILPDMTQRKTTQISSDSALLMEAADWVTYFFNNYYCVAFSKMALNMCS